MSKYKPQHARKRHLRWKPWAKYLHLVSATFALLFASSQTETIIINFWGQVLADLGIAFVIYVGLVIVGGFLFTIIDDEA